MWVRGRLTPEDGAVFLKALEAWLDIVNRGEDEEQEQAAVDGAGDSRPSDVSTETSLGQEAPENVSAETRPQSSPEESIDESKNVSAETSDPELPEPSFAQKRADALMLMAEHSLINLTEGPKSLSSPEKYQIIIHLEPEKLNGRSQEPAESCNCSLESGVAQFPLSAAAARRIACDASLVPVLEDDGGNILNVGRKTRTVPPAIRRALNLRDQGCRFPGCTQSRYVDAHHVQHWCDGGETSLENLITLCRHHHRLMHQEHYEIVKKINGDVIFMKPDGEQMPGALAQQFEETQDTTKVLAIQRQHEALDLKIDADTGVKLWQGEECDYFMAVEALMAKETEQVLND